MNQRNYLKNGTNLELYYDEGYGRNARQFHITRLISNDGGSTIAYRAYHKNSSNIGVLREFYPISEDIVLKRNKNNKLCVEMAEQMEYERENFYSKRERYLAPFKILKEIQLKNENDSMATFIPYFEICYGAESGDLDDGTVYIWTPAPQTETFMSICQRIHENPSEDAEYSLFTAVEAIYSLTQCVYTLHNAGIIHRDIKPENFGFALREGEILTQSIALFDVDSICNAYPKNEDYVGTKGYMPSNNKELLNTSLQDIYAIGASLFYTVIHSNETEKNRFNYDDSYYYQISDLVNNSKLIKMSERNSYPRIRNTLTKILRRCLLTRKTDIQGKSLDASDERRYSGCGELLEDLRTLLGYIIPSEISQRLKTGERWILTDAKKWFRDEDRQCAKQVMQYHLYKWPLYSCLACGEKLRVLVLGMGRYGYMFLDYALQLSQNLNSEVEFVIISNSLLEEEKKDVDLFLSERPALGDFFDIRTHSSLTKDCFDNIGLKSDTYGTIHFISLPIDDAFICKNGKEISSRGFSYIFIDLNTEKENKQVAIKLSQNNTCENNNIITFVLEDGDDYLFADYDAIKPIRLNDNYRHQNDFKDIERMAFNSHLVWNSNPDIDFDDKVKEFYEEYNYESSLSNVLSIKYKLWNVKIDLMEVSFDEAAEEFFKIISFDEHRWVKRMAWLEHKRWVTEKICAGWRKREVADCAGVTQDKKDKTHICIVRSCEEWGLENTKKQEWEENGIDISTLDNLDRVSVELHRFYVKQAANMEVRAFEEVNRGLRNTEAITYFYEWQESLHLAIKRKNKESTEYCKGCFSRLKKSLYRSNLTETSRNHILGTLSVAMEPLTKKYEYTDYKKYDIDLIEKIPYILTYSSHSALVIPMEPVRPDEIFRTENVKGDIELQIAINRVFSYVGAITIVNPEKVLYLFNPKQDNYSDTTESARMFCSVVNRILQYMAKKNLRADLFFRIFCEDKETFSEFANYEDSLNKVIGRKDSYKVVFVQEKEIDDSVKEYVEEIVQHERRVCVERTSVVNNGWLQPSRIEDIYASYCFDDKNMTFNGNEDCCWLSYVGNNSSLRVHDMAALVDRTYSTEENMDFSNEQYDYFWRMYKNDSEKWKNVCRLLKKSELQSIVMLTLKKNWNERGSRKRNNYYVPFACRNGLEKIIYKMKERGYIGNQSNLTPISRGMCLLTLYCGDKMASLFEDKIISHPDFLKESDCIEMMNQDNMFIVRYCTYSIPNEDDCNCQDKILENIMSRLKHGKKKNEEEIKDDAKKELKNNKIFLTDLNAHGYIHGLDFSGNRIRFTFGSQSIKKLFSSEGKLLELRVIKELEHLACMNSIVNGIKFYGIKDDELDCVATKGFRSLIVECKARDNIQISELSDIVNKLVFRVKRLAVNGIGVLLVDSETSLPEFIPPENIIIKRVDEIEFDGEYKIGGYLNTLI